MLEYINCQICGQSFQETAMDRGICNRHPHAERMEYLKKSIWEDMPAAEKAELKKKSAKGRAGAKKARKRKKKTAPTATPSITSDTAPQKDSA